MPLFAIVGTALLLGFIVGYAGRYWHALFRRSSLEIDLKEKNLEAEEKALKIIERAEEKAALIEQETKSECRALEEKLQHKEGRLEKREELLDQRQIDMDSQIENARTKIDEVKAIKVRLDEKQTLLEHKLEEIAGLSQEEAYTRLAETTRRERSEDLTNRLRKIELAGEEQYEDKARNILLAAIHRIGNSLPVNVMTSSVEIPNDEIKGKVIGKEGRNVRAFERLTGVDVLIDDTPGYIVLSSFDSIRREIARVALEKLIRDGRIQPAKIEELVEQSRKEVAQLIKQTGEAAAYEANVPGLHPELITILGRLHFRTSYGQNVLSHSVEVANLAGIIAKEVGANEAVARAGALLHDIGKTVSHEVQGTHVEIGIRILEKYGVDQSVILAMRAHHEEYPYETPESIIVQVCDSISGSRPGARRDSIENYIKRLTDLEAIATKLAGVDKAYAIAAGREVRVLVNPQTLNDLESHELARTIATNIEAQLRYPGEIKVHVIRETRVISYAR